MPPSNPPLLNIKNNFANGFYSIVWRYKNSHQKEFVPWVHGPYNQFADFTITTSPICFQYLDEAERYCDELNNTRNGKHIEAHVVLVKYIIEQLN